MALDDSSHNRDHGDATNQMENGISSVDPTGKAKAELFWESGMDIFESYTHEPEEATHHFLFDATCVTPSMALIRAVAHAADADLLDLPPLYSAIDPDALNDLLSRWHAMEGDIRVELTYANHQVDIRSYGSIEVRPI